MNFTLAELTRIKLEPGEVLSVKLYGDDYEQDNVADLQAKLQSLFPDNKIMMFILPNGNDLQMEVIKPNMEIGEISQEERERREQVLKQEKELIDTLNALPASDCSVPTNYCGDCGCGKKERILSGKQK